MAVPEAAVDKHDGPKRARYEVRTTWQTSTGSDEPNVEASEDLAHN